MKTLTVGSPSYITSLSLYEKFKGIVSLSFLTLHQLQCSKGICFDTISISSPNSYILFVHRFIPCYLYGQSPTYICLIHFDRFFHPRTSYLFHHVHLCPLFIFNNFLPLSTSYAFVVQSWLDVMCNPVYSCHEVFLHLLLPRLVWEGPFWISFPTNITCRSSGSASENRY